MMRGVKVKKPIVVGGLLVLGFVAAAFFPLAMIAPEKSGQIEAGEKKMAIARESAAGSIDTASVAAGKKIAFTRKGTSGVGNCLACHAIAGGESPGNMGPALVNIRQRFPVRADLKARLYDATVFNPISAMPPFGKHGILTDDEIEKVMDFIYTL